MEELQTALAELNRLEKVKDEALIQVRSERQRMMQLKASNEKELLRLA